MFFLFADDVVLLPSNVMSNVNDIITAVVALAGAVCCV